MMYSKETVENIIKFMAKIANDITPTDEEISMIPDELKSCILINYIVSTIVNIIQDEQNSI